jgi:radical SAM protein with 4Fe4S-binding SPASM domain
MLRGDCSIRTEGYGFSAEEIAACAQRQGLLAIELELSASNTCDCPACAGTTPQRILSLDEIHQLIDQAKSLGCRRVILIDCESTSPHLKQTIEYCHAVNLAVELFTAKLNLDHQFLRGNQVSVSLEISEISDLSNLESLKTHLRAIRFAATLSNIGHIANAWRWARSHKIEPHVQIITPPTSAAEATTVLPPTRAKDLFESLARIDREEFNRTWPIDPSLTGRSCKRHLYACHVTPCGTIHACVGITIPLGNICTESLRDILLLSEVLENIRAFDAKVKEPCRTCSKSTDCYGCRGAAYQLTGDYLAADSLCWKNDGIQTESLPAIAADFIPHGPSIRLIDRLTAIGERTAVAEFTVPSDSLWVDELGTLDETSAIEIIAQGFAASHGFHRWAHEAADQQGLLLGIKDLKIDRPARAGEKLTVYLRKVARFGDFGLVEADIRHEDGALFASGQLKVWRPSEEMKAMIS